MAKKTAPYIGKSGTVDLDEKVFGEEFNMGLVHDQTAAGGGGQLVFDAARAVEPSGRAGEQPAPGLGLGDDRVHVLAVEAHGVGGRRGRVGRGDLVGLSRVAELQASVAEVQFGVCHGAVGAIHPVDEFGAEHRYVEVDRGRAPSMHRNGVRLV